MKQHFTYSINGTGNARAMILESIGAALSNARAQFTPQIGGPQAFDLSAHDVELLDQLAIYVKAHANRDGHVTCNITLTVAIETPPVADEPAEGGAA